MTSGGNRIRLAALAIDVPGGMAAVKGGCSAELESADGLLPDTYSVDSPHAAVQGLAVVKTRVAGLNAAQANQKWLACTSGGSSAPANSPVSARPVMSHVDPVS